MKHKFRKYISKRGSALFMVLSVMTSLIVTTMAMYFSVVSSKKTQYAIFNQQQSYQSALSLSESLLGGIISGTDDANKSGFNALSSAVNAMSVGETITTTGNGFYSFDATGGTKIDEDQVGAYIADITFLSDTSEGRLFDFAVTTMVNGTESTVHQYVVIDPSGNPSNPPNRPLPLFVASGLIPSSPALNAGYMFSDVFYDSEFTHFMPYGADSDKNGNAELKIFGDVYASGTLTVNYKVSEADGKNHINGAAKAKPHNWIIRKDLIMTNEICVVPFKSESEIDSAYEDKTNRVIVGGDCIFKSDAKGFQNCEIYVMGNLIIEPGAKIGNNVKIYVNGSKTGTESGTNVSVTVGSWSNSMVNDYATTIEYSTQDLNFYDWNTNYGRKAMGSEKEYDSQGNPIVYPIKGIENEVTAHFARTAGTPSPQFVWSSTNQGCTITGVDGIYGTTGGNVDYENYSDQPYKLIIDTGNNPENVFYIRLKGYLDGGKTFSWCPYYGDYAIWVVVRGKGSVVFEVPDGVTYENRSYKTNVIHENWTPNGAFGSQSTRDQVKNLISQGWIHYDCTDSCCVNPLNKIDGEKCARCGEDMYLLKCSDHNYEKKVCLEDNCDGKSFNHRTDASGKLVSYGTCEYRINDRGSNTPNMNIFLVMCGQNSAIQFTPPAEYMTNNGINESFSSFWGYIYAPYAPLNYSAKLQSGDKIQFVGGIAVGSFNLFGRNSYMPCYPDRVPEDVMAAKCTKNRLPTVDGKSWKEPVASSIVS